jgi:SRSO17 transposase
VLAVASNQKIPTETGSSRADTLAARAPDPAWKRRSCGDGVKGPRLYDWAVATLPDTGTAEHGHRRWLLIRRSIPDPTEIAYYLCYGPEETADEELIRVAGTRWAVEECFQTAKNEVGLDDYQVRRYDAWYRHITLAMWAHAFLAVTAAASKGADPGAGPRRQHGVTNGDPSLPDRLIRHQGRPGNGSPWCATGHPACLNGHQ